MEKVLKSGLRGVVSVANARKPQIESRVFSVPSFFSGWLTTEGAHIKALWHMAIAAQAIRNGRHRTRAGKAGLALEAVTIGGLATAYMHGRNVGNEFEAVLTPQLGAATIDARPTSNRLGDVVPFALGQKKRRVIKDVDYAGNPEWRTTLDIIMPAHIATKAHDTNGELGAEVSEKTKLPVLIQIHGGGWVVGSKRDQAMPLLNHMAANGWLCFSVNYRLCPKVTLREQVEDVKRAIAWVRNHCDEYGGDPAFMCITGGSAGGHLSSLAALTANDPDFQVGFENEDTSVQAAVPFYGVYDFVDEHREMITGFSKFLSKTVTQQSIPDNLETWTRYSPLHRIHPDAPPTLIVHGTLDTLVPVEVGRRFASELHRVSTSNVSFVELAHANHAFDVFGSPRTMRMVEYVERYLTAVHDGSIT